MDDFAIRVENLTKIYKIFDKPTDRVREAFSFSGKRYSHDFYALKDVSFDIKRGESVGIVGKNGAGKSTILKVITGVLTPAAGQVKVNGRIASLLELGAGFNPEMTGIENIYLNGSILGLKQVEIERRLPEIVAFADIGEFIHQPVKMYSSGMFARLAFAVNVNVDPDILIVDEALSVGDAFFQSKCFRKMAEMKNRGITILFVSHDMVSLRQLCQRGIWLENGTKKMDGEIKEVSEAYFSEQLTVNNSLNQNDVHSMSIKAEIETEKGKNIIVVPKVPRATGILSEQVEIKSFYFSQNGVPVNALKVDEIYEANIVAEMKADLDKLIFGFVMDTPKGVTVFAFNTFMFSEQKSISAKAGETLRAVFEFSMPRLQRNTYMVSPSVARGTQWNHVQLTWLENTQAIQVINDGYNNSLIEIPSQIKVERYDAAQVQYTDS